MANICSTTYKLIGSKKVISNFYKKFEKALDNSEHHSLSEVFKAIEPEFKDDTLGNDGWVTFLERTSDDEITIDVESKWSMDTILNSDEEYPVLEDIDIFYEAEELGCEFYQSNDYNNLYFPNNYIVISDNEISYFEEEEDVIKYINDEFSVSVKNMESLYNFIEKYNNSNNDDSKIDIIVKVYD